MHLQYDQPHIPLFNDLQSHQTTKLFADHPSWQSIHLPTSSFFHSTLRPIFHHISSLIPSFSRTAIFSINPSIHQSSHLFSPRLINIIMLYSSILLSTYHILVSFTSSTCRSRFCLIRGFYTIFSSWKGVIPSPWLQICHLPLNVGISTVQMLIGRVGVGIRAGGDC